MKTSAILAAVLAVMGGRAYAAEFANLQAMKVSDINEAAADIAAPVKAVNDLTGKGISFDKINAYREQRSSPVYDIWVGGEAICAEHADHLVAEARAAFEKQYEARLKKAMQKAYLAQGFNQIAAVTFVRNEPVSSGAGRTYRISAPGRRDDSTNVTVWHEDDVDSDEMWADSIHGIVLQKLDILKRDSVRPRVVCALNPGPAQVAAGNDGAVLAQFDPPFYVFEMDLDGANVRPSKAAGLNDAYTRFYGPME